MLIKYCVSLKICSKINSAAIKPQRHREEKKIIQRDKFLLRMKKKKNRKYSIRKINVVYQVWIHQWFVQNNENGLRLQIKRFHISMISNIKYTFVFLYIPS